MELKPCPFCGSDKAPELEYIGNVVGWKRVVCDLLNGGCGASSCVYEDMEEPIEAWNRRV